MVTAPTPPAASPSPASRTSSRFLISFAFAPKRSLLLAPPVHPPPLEEPQLGEHVSRVAALPLAHARRDPLHLPLYVAAALAAELHLDHVRLVGHAAAPVRAHAAVGGPKLFRTGAA